MKKENFAEMSLAQFLKQWLFASEIEVSIVHDRLVEVKVLKTRGMELRP